MNWCCNVITFYIKIIYVKTSNTALDLVTKIIAHFYIDFTSRLLKQIWLFPYPYGFCNPVRIHGMKINDMIWYMTHKCEPQTWREILHIVFHKSGPVYVGKSISQTWITGFLYTTQYGKTVSVNFTLLFALCVLIKLFN